MIKAANYLFAAFIYSYILSSSKQTSLIVLAHILLIYINYYWDFIKKTVKVLRNT